MLACVGGFLLVLVSQRQCGVWFSHIFHISCIVGLFHQHIKEKTKLADEVKYFISQGKRD